MQYKVISFIQNSFSNISNCMSVSEWRTPRCTNVMYNGHPSCHDVISIHKDSGYLYVDEQLCNSKTDNRRHQMRFTTMWQQEYLSTDKNVCRIIYSIMPTSLWPRMPIVYDLESLHSQNVDFPTDESLKIRPFSTSYTMEHNYDKNMSKTRSMS